MTLICCRDRLGAELLGYFDIPTVKQFTRDIGTPIIGLAGLIGSRRPARTVTHLKFFCITYTLIASCVLGVSSVVR